LTLVILPRAALAADVPSWACPAAPDGLLESDPAKVVHVAGSDKQVADGQTNDLLDPPD
jgi:hypothetical protein